MNERQNLKQPASQLADTALVAEVRELHTQFEQLSKRYEQAPVGQRAEIREEMAPIVNRERELREEFTGRLSPELTHDRVPSQQIGYSR